ncbi:AAA domain-containing protein [Flavilitoribacter nigricans]|uniref:AAA family ATPase n=1 Tax=Flavilitoribacter nigricans (strain ATCC 23147 / DSM 23189 / NBRC 102662 / NCIMB 1420 / SS-2) TaxID=1122177 RepID=A0A2D0N6Q0_FLAN2|nr:AAA domain-containing protein [Flavilitoribacter nigricans]PHN04056.1 AAA family ATPase [Flavilitoribacter nigricans DSM 23189 = NBRC 102662]
MTDIQKALDHLRELVQLEKQEDFEQHRQKILQLPLDKRVSEGYSWYPVVVSKSGYALGDRAFVIVERTGEEKPDQFRAGKMVSLFTQQPEVRHPEKNGVIQFVNRNRMKIILNSSDLPDWLGMGQIGVNLMFDERTYLEMDKALVQVSKAKGDRLAELRDILFGKQAARFDPTPHTFSIPDLNESQNAAINQIVAARDVAVIHGPPGTGKTTTLVQAIKILVDTESTVLVTAPSNTAVDVLTERLADAGLNVVRIGNISRVDESILSHTLDWQISHHPDNKHIKKVKIEAAEVRRQAKRFKRNFGPEERRERGQMFRQAGELNAWARQLEDRLLDHILSSAQVITCTLVGAANEVLQKRNFRTVLIDEAAQALEPACWIPITKASRVVLAGDPFQLPPTVKSRAAEKAGLNITLIEKCLQRLEHTSLLRVQYRMNEVIMGFSNQRFYEGALRAAESVKDHRLPIEDNHPLVFIDTAGCGFDEKLQLAYLSRFNPEEFLILREHLYALIKAFREQEQPLPEIAIISPYREQVKHMDTAIAEDTELTEVPLTINTIDGFQGQESDVVYISLVRSNGKGEIGFLKDYRRMNVAMTRARQQLIVIGDSATIGNDPFYIDFLEYCEKHGEYRTAWEFMQ